MHFVTNNSQAIDTTQDEPRAAHDVNPVFECAVLARLPSHTLHTCKLVSKTWLASITSPLLVESHLKNSIQNNLVNIVLFNPTINTVGTINGDTFHPAAESYKFKDLDCNYYSILGSCHGLVCLGPSNFKDGIMLNFVIYNPATRVQKRFSVTELQKVLQSEYTGFGFGCLWDQNTDSIDYKLAFIKGREIHVYSVKLASLRRIQNYSCDSFLSKCLSTTSNVSVGVATGSVVHWLLEGDNISLKGVFSLDLNTEMQYETPLPTKNYGKPWLVPLRGRLHIVSNTYSLADFLSFSIVVDIWVMNKYGNFNDSWIHLFKVRLDDIVYSAIPISLKEGGRKVLFQLWRHQLAEHKKSFVWYDLITQQRDGKELHDVESNLIDVPCLDTLFDPCLM